MMKRRYQVTVDVDVWGSKEKDFEKAELDLAFKFHVDVACGGVDYCYRASSGHVSKVRRLPVKRKARKNR